MRRSRTEQSRLRGNGCGEAAARHADALPPAEIVYCARCLWHQHNKWRRAVSLSVDSHHEGNRVHGEYLRMRPWPARELFAVSSMAIARMQSQGPREACRLGLIYL